MSPALCDNSLAIEHFQTEAINASLQTHLVLQQYFCDFGAKNQDILT